MDHFPQIVGENWKQNLKITTQVVILHDLPNRKRSSLPEKNHWWTRRVEIPQIPATSLWHHWSFWTNNILTTTRTTRRRRRRRTTATTTRTRKVVASKRNQWVKNSSMLGGTKTSKLQKLQFFHRTPSGIIILPTNSALKVEDAIPFGSLPIFGGELLVLGSIYDTNYQISYTFIRQFPQNSHVWSHQNRSI